MVEQSREQASNGVCLQQSSAIWTCISVRAVLPIDVSLFGFFVVMKMIDNRMNATTVFPSYRSVTETQALWLNEGNNCIGYLSGMHADRTKDIMSKLFVDIGRC